MGDFFTVRQNPIYSFNQVIDTIRLSAYSPNLSQEKGFPESRDWGRSRHGQMRFCRVRDKIHGSDFSETKYASSPEPTTLSLYVDSQVTPRNHWLHSLCVKNTPAIKKCKRKKIFLILSISMFSCLPKSQNTMIGVPYQEWICIPDAIVEHLESPKEVLKVSCR